MSVRVALPGEFLDSLDPKANLDGLISVLQSSNPPFLLKVAELDGAAAGFSILGESRYQANIGTVERWALNVDPGHWRICRMLFPLGESL